MKVSSKIPAAVNKQNPAAKASTAKKDAKETAQGNTSRKAPTLPENQSLVVNKCRPIRN